MDHLPLPHNPMHEPIEIPCLSTENYDGRDFGTYPDRQGYTPRTIRQWYDIINRPSKEFSAFLQRWLFFGLMEEVLGERIEVSDFIRRVGDPGHLIVTTAKLLPMLRKLIDFGRRHQRGSSYYTVFKNLGIAMRINAAFTAQKVASESALSETARAPFISFIERATFADPRDPRIAMSMALMNETLRDAFILASIETDQNLPAANTDFPEGRCLVYFRMRSDGWCPSELSMMFTRLNCAGLYFMSHVERPNPARKHPMIRVHPAAASATASAIKTEREFIQPGDLCTKFKCSAYQLHEETYRTKHVEGCPGCYDIVADEREIFRILKSGCIPLILSIDSEDENRHVTLVESGPDVEYVAISHVWSDGLGNVQRNALPRCQMLHLSNLIRSLPGKAHSVLFWIDTIGCPPDAAVQKEAQNLAISMMRQTYEDACAVLVLDSWLQLQKIDDMDDAEILLKIVCSAWNSRLWTLQEGALAKALYFQFADKQYSLEEGLDSLNKSDNLAVQLSLKASINQRVLDFRRFRDSGNTIEQKIAALTRVCGFRSTSVASDEAICLGALLDLDVMQIVQTRGEDRMVKLWSLLTRVPSTLLFHEYPRLKTKGYRWAPPNVAMGRRRLRGTFNELQQLNSPTHSSGLAHSEPRLDIEHRNLSVRRVLLRER